MRITNSISTITPCSLKLTFAFAFSLSLSFPSPSSSRIPPLKTPILRSSLSPLPPNPPPPQNLAADILCLLGSRQDSSKIPAEEADEIRSCLRFLVPSSSSSSSSRNFEKFLVGSRKREVLEERDHGEDELVRWPPAAVMELARLAIDSGGDPAVIQRSLDPTVLKVPDVEGLAKDKCQLTKTPTAYRFANMELNSYFAFLFQMISDRAPSVGFNVSLSRYDLFHGHLFIATSTGRLGILFHAKEYPAYKKKVFPFNLGYCQRGSNVVYDDSMNLRNILWLAPLPSNVTKAWVAPGTLVVLDAHPGGIIYKKLVPEYVEYVRTIYEDDFGEVVADVNYLHVNGAIPGDRIFIC